ncbi:alpha/beta-hydrolase [Conidiobolus coronatus NRRL 28638]|uniref:Alpha/beta-hydrolase n=1 Tax=Conidiobolus coronatus (strain ATCC 28846 / CBS 209.66 / NRRL 28638) TaxID=796925 RepID=A0A137PAU4_CONC2|nr:alpha/beta-hydrolase [Conidiobolus coronatus NRRL 28638]|eukprot:KXN72094.1 alpha/beta-hydrolase [Conidiobolus coronatus NRRL 28638]
MALKDKLKILWLIINGILLHLIRGPLRKSWSLKESVYIHILRNTAFSRVDSLVEFRKSRDSRLANFPKNSKLEKITIPSKYRQQAHEIVNNHLKKTYGNGDWYGQESLWSSSKPLEAEWLIPNHLTLTPESNIIFYNFGGGHIFGSFSTYRAQLETIAQASDCIVFGANYRHAPDYSAPCQLEDLVSQILYLTAPIDNDNSNESGCGFSFDQIVVSGDSAGGNMSASLIHFMRDLNIGKFSGAVLFSPWLDLTASQFSVVDCDAFDFIPKVFTVTPTKGYKPETGDKGYKFAYYGSTKEIQTAMLNRGHLFVPLEYINTPIVSPLCDDKFNDLPPILINVGEAETLRLEPLLYLELINNSYTPEELNNSKIPPVTVHYYQDMVHVFPVIFPNLKSSQICFTRTSNFIKQCFEQKSTRLDSIKRDYPINTQLLSGDNLSLKLIDHKRKNLFISDLNQNLSIFDPDYKLNPIFTKGLMK